MKVVSTVALRMLGILLDWSDSSLMFANSSFKCRFGKWSVTVAFLSRLVERRLNEKGTNSNWLTGDCQAQVLGC